MVPEINQGNNKQLLIRQEQFIWVRVRVYRTVSSMERFAFFTCHYGKIKSDVGVKRVSKGGGPIGRLFLTSFLKRRKKRLLLLNKNEMNILLKKIIEVIEK